MPILRPLPSSLFLSWVVLAASAASAAGIGAATSGAVMGQPLDFAVQVRLEPGQVLEPQCVSAEVTSGDRRLPAPLVRTSVEMVGLELALIHVLTQQAIQEPVLSVELNVGCASRMSRRFVLLADPPELAPAIAAAPAAVDALTSAATQMVLQVATPVALGALAADLSSAKQATPAAAVAGRALRPRLPGGRAEGAARRVQRKLARADRRQVATTRTALARKPPLLAPAPARLKLDMLEPAGGAEAAAVEQALEAVAQAASAARAAASAASASAERIQALEQTVEQLRAENKSRADLTLALRERLAQVDTANAWLWPLLFLSGAMALLAAWLAWRLTGLQRVQQLGWRGAATPNTGVVAPGGPPSRQAATPVPFVKSSPPTDPAGTRPRAVPAWPPASPVVSVDDDTAVGPAGASAFARTQVMVDTRPAAAAEARLATAAAARLDALAETEQQRTDVLPSSPVADASAPRDVSIEELIDLEQQAEFFVVLGQDEAAVDLLVEHLRSTGGGSPLPYLKLLEIHHRLGDRAAYERTRTRFNHRFNAYAPEWGADMHGGRSLEDYAGVLPRLQQVWGRPLDTMAELEALLFRKSRGELFDLPAYREVLFLYSLARDLMDREAADSGSVDLLLPLSDGGDFGSTAPAPFLGLDRTAEGEPRVDFDNRPTAPVDFDISVAERATSIFDTLDDKPQHRRH